MKAAQIPLRNPSYRNFFDFFKFLIFINFILLLSSITFKIKYDLPRPLSSSYHLNHSELNPAFYESSANHHIHHLAHTIGHRIVGSKELNDSFDYCWDILQSLRAQSELLPHSKLIEIFLQTDDGAHLFKFMGKPVWKKYIQLSNLVVHVSDPSLPQSKHNAILVNAHLDSTLSSPGAADDAAGIAIMLEIIRVIIHSPNWKLYNGIIFLFNGAEESFQDASHLFITKHPLKDIVRAVINLEACGMAGPEMLFQATSNEMIKAYSKIPRPSGNIIATEIFATGLINSDTDFRQFVQYANLTGLDMALVQNSYFYHTSRDIPSNIQPGAIQHMGENTLALLKHLTSSSVNLTNIKSSSDLVFFSILRLFFIIYTKTTAIRSYITLTILSMSFVIFNIKPQLRKVYFWSFIAVICSFLSSIITPNLVAFFFTIILKKPLSWFRHEYFPLLLFLPFSILGALFTQFQFSKILKRSNLLEPRHQYILSHSTLFGLISFNGIISILVASFKLGFAYLPASQLLSMTLALLINDLILAPFTLKFGHLHLVTYLIGSIIPFSFGLEHILSLLDVLVPLSGRIGHQVPIDYIMASLVGLMGSLLISVFLPLAHRFSSRALGQFLFLISLSSSILLYWFARPQYNVFDVEHPKRLGILHMQNLTTNPPQFGLHIASIDGASGFDNLVQDIIDSLGLPHKTPILNAINDDIPDWDIIFPVSQFLKSYQIPLTSVEHHSLVNEFDKVVSHVSPSSKTFKVNLLSEKIDFIHHQRTLSLVINHPGIIWSVIAFTADVVAWDLPEPPSRGIKRHHVKVTNAFSVDQWTLNLTIALRGNEFEAAIQNEQINKGQRPAISAFDQLGQSFAKSGKLRIDYSGLEEMALYLARSQHKKGSLVSQKKITQQDVETERLKEEPPSVRIFKKMEQSLPNWIDPLFLSAISNFEFV
ncbi:hypothetical protein O181_015520 [Austropuccinia psidii MF-1]|uniref:Peptide hydrolase n=1 Tax=Austropuccinia psidii MF-1 TaxID=1389203 RepID=A0A9Q3C338_9BASI|nr:hypothetical protein [Austropuccinia psidii MF-1]